MTASTVETAKRAGSAQATAADTQTVALTVNGKKCSLDASPFATLADGLRESLKLAGTKLGCEAGDCGACTVLLDGKQVCSCLVPLGQCSDREIVTVEGQAVEPLLADLQQAFLTAGAAQCGICTPGMLLSALDLLKRNSQPDRTEVEDAIGGTLCRCTGYVKIIDAVMLAAGTIALADDKSAVKDSLTDTPPTVPLASVGRSLERVDGQPKVAGSEAYGADQIPAGCLWMRVIRSPYAHAEFSVGDTQSLLKKYPGLERVLSAADVPGHNGFGIYPDIKDQPVLAAGRVLFRGEAVLALVGDRECVEAIAHEELPLSWTELPVIDKVAAALADGADLLHKDRSNNVLIKGRVRKGDDACFNESANSELKYASGEWETAFVEHAYIEPEAGFAIRRGERIEVHASTQAPQMDLEEIANVLGLELDAVRVVPTACGGGFGGKLDVSVQPLLAVAAWVLDRPVGTVYNRVESMASSTKRHPAQLSAEAVATADGTIKGYRLQGDFNTGAYASWGPTVAGRVPAHCCGPYNIENVFCETRAVHTNGPPSGAFRGFGTPQAAIPRELLYDELAESCDIDRLEFRLKNAFRAGDTTPTGQRLDASCGLAECLQALRPDWQKMCEERDQFNAAQSSGRWLRGVGIACMWYGCGNTALSNPSAMRVELTVDGRFVFYNGAVDIGQGSSTVLSQICADALGVRVAELNMVNGDTDLTEDAGKTSASRQTFVSGRAAQLAGLDLQTKLLQLLGINSLGFDGSSDSDGNSDSDNGDDNDDKASVFFQIDKTNKELVASVNNTEHRKPLAELQPQSNQNAQGDAVIAEGYGEFDPPITALDENGQGRAYATYAFAAQICTVDIDTRYGVVKPRRFVASHDVGKAVNPQLVEGQIHGGIMQGLGMALMEEYVPGVTENLHDYLIPTAGDVPQIDIIIVEAPEPLGPYGAKGVGEPALVPTPAAILSAIRDASGIVMHKVPVLPHRMFDALQQAGLANDT